MFGSLHFQSKLVRLIFQVSLEKWLFISFFVFELSDLNFNGFFAIFIPGIIISSITSVLDRLVCFFVKKLPSYRTINSNEHRGRMQNFCSSCYFFSSIWAFFCRHWRFPGHERRGGGHFYSCLSCPLAKVKKYVLSCDI